MFLFSRFCARKLTCALLVTVMEAEAVSVATSSMCCCCCCCCCCCLLPFFFLLLFFDDTCWLHLLLVLLKQAPSGRSSYTGYERGGGGGGGGSIAPGIWKGRSCHNEQNIFYFVCSHDFSIRFTKRRVLQTDFFGGKLH